MKRMTHEELTQLILCQPNDTVSQLVDQIHMAWKEIDRLTKDNKEMNETMKWLGEGYDDPPVMTRTMIETNNREKLTFPPFKIGK